MTQLPVLPLKGPVSLLTLIELANPSTHTLALVLTELTITNNMSSPRHIGIKTSASTIGAQSVTATMMYKGYTFSLDLKPHKPDLSNTVLSTYNYTITSVEKN